MEIEPIRAFIAIDVPEEIKERMLESAKGLGKDGLRFVEKDQLHITLFFFDRLDTQQRNRVMELMAGLGSANFQIGLSGFGTFTSERPRVVYVNVIDTGELAELYDHMRESITAMGLKAEDRAFTPHLTIARVKQIGKGRAEAIKEFVSGHKNEEFGTFPCNEIKLIKSTLTGEKPIHEVVYAKRLG